MADTTYPQTSQDYGTMSSQTMQPQPKMVFPQNPFDMTPYSSIINGALTSLPDFNAEVDRATKTSDALLSRIAGMSGDIANKENYLRDQQNLQGVNDKQAVLDSLRGEYNTLYSRIKGLGTEAQAIPLKVQQQNLGTGATDAGVAPQEAGALRENAIKALTLSSQADVLTGQITNSAAAVQSAKDKAQQAVDLKYKPLEANLANFKDMLELNQKYILDPAEKKRVEATNIALAERTRLLNEQKQNEKDNTDLIINATSQGAPSSLVTTARQMAQAGKKPAEIAAALGVYSGDYIGNQAKLASIRNANLDYMIKNNEFKQSQQPAIGSVDGVVVQGQGANSLARNTSTLEQLIRSKGKQIPDAVQTNIANIQGVLNSLDQLVKGNPEGTFKGLYPTAGALDVVTPDILKSKETIANRSTIEAINLKVQQWASGASLSKDQTASVLKLVPVLGDTDNVIKEKVNKLTDLMNGQVSASLTGSGIKYRPEAADYYSNSIASKVKNALGSNYSPTEVVESLAKDPTWADKIAQARRAKWSDQQITTYLQSIQDVEQPQERNSTKEFYGIK